MILFHDVDGCLNPGHGAPLEATLTSEQRELLERLGALVDASPMEHLVLNTGRCLDECLHIIEAIATPKLRYVLVEHGSLLHDTHTGSDVDLHAVAEAAGRHDVRTKLGSVSGVERLGEWYAAAGRFELARAIGAAEPLEWIRAKTRNLTIAVPDVHDGEATMATLRTLVANSAALDGDPFTWHYAASERFIDAMGDVDKGTGVVLACDHLGIDVATTAGVGNGLNDLAMLEVVGTPLCPANAEPEVKALCSARDGDCLPHDYVDATFAWLTANT